ncbi:hypothetical protein BJ138DRAFT_1081557 [Hygrophoropsis aurantiaca]|uniref:Uncharacterized protein n=1 Tax=Hygrophoropsis aurantiaca TaxID=72124 RepID=A0ACB8AJY7_9AGAM|nr:hypothetical protein BJ138DRAFT_1081557 [Hygrophoropsis aurantiaca]
MNYAEIPNNNLICCICHAPFTAPTTTKTCSHTFCHDCIAEAVKHSPQCPIDRSPLSLEDLLPANPIVKHLVDELIVECAQRSAGCTHTCQRQLLASHLNDACQYIQVPCPESDCSQLILRKDLGKHAEVCAHRSTECDGCGIEIKNSELDVSFLLFPPSVLIRTLFKAHNLECPSQMTSCSYCSAELSRNQLKDHTTSCPDATISCSQADNGCPWSGPRRENHADSCPYEAIKGFFAVNHGHMTSLTTENAALKHRIQVLESVVHTMQREMQSLKTILGPWYRQETAQPRATFVTPTFDAGLAQFSPPSTGPSSASSSFHTDPNEPLYSPIPTEADALALYFPPEVFPETHSVPRRSMSFHGSGAPLTPVAPLNLSTTLEDSLGGLRDSIAAISASVDSLARRNNITLTNETMRINEDIGSLRYTVQGIRVQLHHIMMDRNAQLTGRASEHQPVLHPPMVSPPFPGTSGTKL